MKKTFNNFNWNDFQQKTSFGKEPFLFENILPFSNGFSDNKTVEEAFLNFLEKKENSLIDTKFRIYDGEKRRDDIVDKILDLDTIPKNKNFTEFIKDILNKDKFSLVINNLEQISPKLYDDLAVFQKVC